MRQLILLASVSLVLAACGIKGPLEHPPPRPQAGASAQGSTP
ncbi:MAG: lipoprotein [Candidatus Dactylopiibacterium sp.]|nr:lipoprotein [Candidatus Dactylopiibacterium sp.]